MRRYAPLLVAALLAGCSSRDHANPFDPRNPVTGGRPPGFTALAGSQLVELRWTRASFSSDFGYRLFRRVEGETDFAQIGPELGGSVTSYFDFGLENGRLHEYRIYYVFSGTSGGLPAEDFATPGPQVPWFADLSRRTVMSITPDGRHVLSETGGFFGPTHVAVEPRSGTVWISDTYDGAVVVLDPTTGGRTTIRGIREPVTIALDPIDGTAWICDQGFTSVYHYQRSGQIGTPAQITGLSRPIGVATDPVNGNVWVCERTGNQVRRFTRAGAALGTTAVSSPSRVAVDSLTSDGWVTSLEGGQLVHISTAGDIVNTVPLSGPIGVAVDPRRDRIWVADARAGQVVAVRRGGAIEFQVGGLVETRDVAVDLATGDAWVTAPGIRAVLRISATGAVLQRLTGLSDPYGIAVDPGRAR